MKIGYNNTVTQRYPLVYGYAAMLAAITLIGLFVGPHDVQSSTTTVFTPHELRVFYIYGAVVTITYHAALIGFLLLSKSLRHVLLLLKILLALALLGLLALIFKPAPYALAVGLVRVGFTFFVIKRLSGAVLPEPKQEHKQAPLTVRAFVSKFFVFLFRLSIISYGFMLVGAGLVLLSHEFPLLFRYGLPICCIGLLYLMPYYFFGKRMQAVYAALLAVVTMLTVYWLYLPIKSGSYAPANLPFPGQLHDPFVIWTWTVFHSSGFLIPDSIVIIVFDILVRCLKPGPQKRAIISLLVTSLVVALLMWASIQPAAPTIRDNTNSDLGAGDKSQHAEPSAQDFYIPPEQMQQDSTPSESSTPDNSQNDTELLQPAGATNAQPLPY